MSVTDQRRWGQRLVFSGLVATVIFITLLRIPTLSPIFGFPVYFFLPGFLLLRKFCGHLSALPSYLLSPAFSIVVVALSSLLINNVLGVGFIVDQVAIGVLCFVLILTINGDIAVKIGGVKLRTLALIVGSIGIILVIDASTLLSYNFPLGWDVWSYMANTASILRSGVIPTYFTGSYGILSFYPPLFGYFSAFVCFVMNSPPLPVFYALPFALGPIFVVTVFGAMQNLTCNETTSAAASLLAATIGSEIEGLNRAFPIALGMIAFPLAVAFCFDFLQERRVPDFLASVMSVGFLWLTFPLFAIPLSGTLIIIGLLSLITEHRLSVLISSIIVVVLSASIELIWLLPYFVRFGWPTVSKQLPSYMFGSVSLSLTSFAKNIVSVSLFIPLAVFSLRGFKFLQGKEKGLVALLFAVGFFTLPVTLPVLNSIVSPDRFTVLLGLVLCMLAGVGFSKLNSRTKSRFYAAFTLGLFLTASFGLTAYENYQYAPRAMTQGLYQAILWIGNNTPPGSKILTLDYRSGGILAIAGGDRRALFDQATVYGFWLTKDAIAAYNSTVSMFMSTNESYRLGLFKEYEISYVLITSETLIDLSRDLYMNITSVQSRITTNFFNDSHFQLVYPDIRPLYQISSSNWSQLAHASNGTQLQILWDSQSYWLRPLFRSWLEMHGVNLNEITWDTALDYIQNLPPPPASLVARYVPFASLGSEFIFEVVFY